MSSEWFHLNLRRHNFDFNYCNTVVAVALVALVAIAVLVVAAVAVAVRKIVQA